MNTFGRTRTVRPAQETDMNRQAVVAATTVVAFVAMLTSGDLLLAGVAAVFGYFLGETLVSVGNAVRP